MRAVVLRVAHTCVCDNTLPHTYTHTHTHTHFPTYTLLILKHGQRLLLTTTREYTIIVAVTEGLVREEQLLHDMCLLGAVTVEITQILTRARNN